MMGSGLISPPKVLPVSGDQKIEVNIKDLKKEIQLIIYEN
jgi:hypothetical protein